MEEVKEPRRAERARNGEARLLRGCETRPVSSATARMCGYSEIFGDFASSCSIPVLVLPESVDVYGEPLDESQTLDYLDIFGAYDAGTFPLSYEELVSTRKGSSEEDHRFQGEANVHQFEAGASMVCTAVPTAEHVPFPNVNEAFSSFNSSLDTEQLDVANWTRQQSMMDETHNKICSFVSQSNYEPDFEEETVSFAGFVEVESPKDFTSDDQILHGYNDEEDGKEKQSEILSRCFVHATVDSCINDSKPLNYFTKEGNAEILDQHSRSSSYHSASSGDIPFSDYSFLTISDINLHTQPLQVPPPSRAPPKLDTKQEMCKFEALKASNTTLDKELIPEPCKSCHVNQVGPPRTRHALKETVKTNSPVCLNVKVDAGSAAAAAMIEAMEQAQASLKSAKELMERKRYSPQSERKLDHHDFGAWNVQNVHKTKMAQKVVPTQLECGNLVFSENAKEPIRGNGSTFNVLSDEKEKSHEWRVDKKFYELVDNEMMTTKRVINDEQRNSNGAIKLAHQLNACQIFLEKEACGKQQEMFSWGNSENEVGKFNKCRINEKTLNSGSELKLQDGNAKKIKFRNTVDNEKILDILETFVVPSLQGDDEYKQKVGPLFQVCHDRKLPLGDTISLIQCDEKGNKLIKQCQESHTHGEGEKNEDDNNEPNAHGRNDLDFMDFYGDSMVQKFDDGEPVTSEFTVNEQFEAKLSSLQNGNEVEVGTAFRTSFSSDTDSNLEDVKEKCLHVKVKKTRKGTCIDSYNEAKEAELEDIDNTSEMEVSGDFHDTDKTSGKKNDMKLKHEQMSKLNITNRSEANIVNLCVEPHFLANAKEVLEFKQNIEPKLYELPHKFEKYENKLTTDGEQGEGKKQFENFQAALELEANMKASSTCQQVIHRNRVQDCGAVQQVNSLDKKANILNPSLEASGSSSKQMEKNRDVKLCDANIFRKEVTDRERKEAEQKRILEKERAREREKDRIAVEKTTGEYCEKVFAEARERPEKIVFERIVVDARPIPITEHHDIIEKPTAKACERSEKIANEAKLRAERAAVERATAEARERAIEKALAEHASLEVRTQMETLVTTSKDKKWKNDVSEGIVSSSDKVSEISLKPTSNMYDAPVDIKPQSASSEGESPLRCKARQERYQRIVERAANALAEKNMRDLVAQREQAERNRLAESLDAEVRRWSNGKEGNLRALLSTLQYILGHDGGWQPIPLTEIITAAAVRKAYRKATLYLHPDKLQQRGASIQHKYICEKVFDLLKDAWNKFNSEGR